MRVNPARPALFSRVLTALMLICGAAFLAISVLLPVLADLARGAPLREA